MNRVPPSATAGSPSCRHFHPRHFCCLQLFVCLCTDFEVCGLDLFSDFPENGVYGVLEFVFLMRDFQEVGSCQHYFSGFNNINKISPF